MAKVTYASLKLKPNTEVKTVKFGDVEIEVKQYLSIEDKYDIIMSTVKNAKDENGLYNDIKVDLFFHLFLIYKYAGITFTEKQKEDEIKLYDTIMSTGLMDTILSAIPETEYNFLYNSINKYMTDDLKYNTTAAAVIRSLITDLPKQAEAANKIIENFDKEKFQAVIDFAQAANGGRPIK